VSIDTNEWEYQCIPPDITEDKLNQLGKLGWELASVKKSGVLVFKRPTGKAVKISKGEKIEDTGSISTAGN
jgi:hypothetical protein